MPTLIDFGGGKKVEMTYDAAGVMLTKKVYNTGAVLVENRTYNNGMEFVAYGTGNQVLELVHHSQGYYKPSVSRHIYTIKDHLDNTRIVYTDANNDGSIAQSSTEILDENHYYSYGMEMTDPSWYNGTEYKYKFNGIERTESIGLNIDLALYRGLDPVLGKWYQVDPKAEVMGNMSPYCAMNNNPVSYSDPEGDLPFLAVVAIGAATGILSNGLVNISSDRSFFDGAGKAALWGGIGAAASAGVGAVFGASGAFGHEFLRAGAHAVTQGGIAVAQGGSFWQGAASGGIGSGISSGIAALGGTAGHQIVGGGIGGGIGSSMNGGNFWQGFGQGIAVGAFNHALHSGLNGKESGDPPTKLELKIRMYEDYAAGKCTQIEYLHACDIIDNNPVGLLQNVWEFHKYEIAATAAGIGFTKFVGTVWKAGGWTQWLNKGNWWRYGQGPYKGQMVKRIAWGSHPKYINNVPKILRPINKWLRNLGGGHHNF